MSKWRNFANGVGPEPGILDNTTLIKKIKRNRGKYNNPESDSDIGLADKQDYYIISVGFFKFFFFQPFWLPLSSTSTLPSSTGCL